LAERVDVFSHCLCLTSPDTELVTAAGLQDGRFLVRPRTGKKGQYVLCVVFRGKPTHHLIAKTPAGVYAINKKSYDGHKNVGGVRFFWGGACLRGGSRC